MPRKDLYDTELLSTQNLVESPFIILKIGKYTFGSYSGASKADAKGTSIEVTYPNYLNSISIEKVNGMVNNYSIRLVYPIEAGDDPNLFEKIFSSVSNTREITISYGDWSSPNQIYKDESALITEVKSSIDFVGSKIEYRISAVANFLSLSSTRYDFPARNDKPSDVFFDLLQNSQYQLSNLFPGMRSIAEVKRSGLIPTNDKQVKIEAKNSSTLLDYLNYLCSCMTPEQDDGEFLYNTLYYLTIEDDPRSSYGGAYFQVHQVQKVSGDFISSDTYEVNIGYPENHFVTNFQIQTDDTYSLLYDYSQDIHQNNYRYHINNDGEVIVDFSPSIARDTSLNKVTAADRSWWSKVTNFPIEASLTIRGLVRPSILMSYVRVNCWFYGRRYIASGLYVITSQKDTVDQSGYKTQLSLLRVGGDLI